MTNTDFSILAIGDSHASCAELSILLDFIGEKVHQVEASNWKESAPEAKTLLAILICIKTDSKSLLKLLSEIRVYEEFIPVLLVADKQQLSDIPPSKLSQVVAQLELPCKYNQLLTALHQCHICRNQKKPSLMTRSSTKSFRSLVGQSASITAVRQLIEQVSATEANVLILGESGTGKED